MKFKMSTTLKIFQWELYRIIFKIADDKVRKCKIGNQKSMFTMIHDVN